MNLLDILSSEMKIAANDNHMEVVAVNMNRNTYKTMAEKEEVIMRILDQDLFPHFDMFIAERTLLP